MGSRAGLDGLGKPRPQRDKIPGPSSPHRVAKPITLSRPGGAHIFGKSATPDTPGSGLKFYLLERPTPDTYGSELSAILFFGTSDP